MAAPKTATAGKGRALILGGRGDIGSGIAAAFAARGMDVVATGRAELDLGNGKSIEKFFAGQPGDFDVLVHSAGLNNPKLFEDLTQAELQACVDVNLMGFLDVTRRLVPGFKRRGGGRIVVLSSLYGFLARKGRLPYVISKHALVGAVKTLAIELAPHGILVNALSPGFVDTKMTRKNNSPDVIAGFVAGIPAGRLGTPADIAAVALFLCSPENTYLTGQDIVVDGGFSIGGFQQ